MKVKIICKSIFAVFLLFLLVSLLLIINDKEAKMNKMNNYYLYNSYTILYDNVGKDCMNNPELFYKDGNYNYSLPCISSYDTYLVWSDGTKELVKNALENKKVDINSLVNHGLKVDKDAI